MGERLYDCGGTINGPDLREASRGERSGYGTRRPCIAGQYNQTAFTGYILSDAHLRPDERLDIGGGVTGRPVELLE